MNFFVYHSLIISALIITGGCSKQPDHIPSISDPLVPEKRSLCENMVDFWFYRIRTVQPGKCYRSGQLSTQRLRACIERYGIKSIINLRGYHPELAWWQHEKKVTDAYKIQFYNVSMNSKMLHSKELITTLLSIFETAPHPILVHCTSGVDRAGEAAAIWLLAHENASKKAASKQLSYRYFHIPPLWGGGTMDFFISLWQGKEWAKSIYDPTHYQRELAHIHR